MAASPASGSFENQRNERRVLSVAPRDVGDNPDGEVVCPSAVRDELTLADLRESIEQLLKWAENARDECGVVTARLEERVQLGARMLRAFEIQLGRAEETLGRLVSQLEVEGAAALTDRITHLEERLADLERTRTDGSESAATVSHAAPLVEQVMNVVREGLREEFAALAGQHSGSIVPSSAPLHRPRLSLHPAESEYEEPFDEEAASVDTVDEVGQSRSKRATGWG